MSISPDKSSRFLLPAIDQVRAKVGQCPVIAPGGPTGRQSAARWQRIVRRAPKRAMGLSTCHIGTRVIGPRSRLLGATWRSEVVESDSAFPQRTVEGQ